MQTDIITRASEGILTFLQSRRKTQVLRLFEKLSTSPMTEYPYQWIGISPHERVGPEASGVISEYCNLRYGGLRLNNQGPERGDFVFSATKEGSPAFEVTYSDRKTGRLRVTPTTYRIEHNTVLRQHIETRSEGPHPRDSRIFLTEEVGHAD